MFTALMIALTAFVLACAALAMIVFHYEANESELLSPIGASFPPISKDLISAAEAGDSDAEVVLGLAYRKGRGVRQSYDEAAKWFKIAAAKGNMKAKDQLGILYYMGRGVKKDGATAFENFREAYKGNNK